MLSVQRVTARSKVFMLDMDGVVLRHPTVFKVLSNRINSFVRQKINPYMEEHQAIKINDVLYKEFGHSVIGLQKVYDSNITVKDFCDYVYDKNFLSYIEILNKEKVFNENAHEVKRLLESCKDKGVPVFIFSNANERWCRTVLDSMNVEGISKKNIIGCDSDAYLSAKELGLKPHKVAYSKAVQYIYKQINDKDEKEFVYVDDQIKNLIPVLHNNYWKPVWFNTDLEKPMMRTASMYTVRDISDLHSFI